MVEKVVVLSFMISLYGSMMCAVEQSTMPAQGRGVEVQTVPVAEQLCFTLAKPGFLEYFFSQESKKYAFFLNKICLAYTIEYKKDGNEQIQFLLWRALIQREESALETLFDIIKDVGALRFEDIMAQEPLVCLKERLAHGTRGLARQTSQTLLGYAAAVCSKSILPTFVEVFGIRNALEQQHQNLEKAQSPIRTAYSKFRMKEDSILDSYDDRWNRLISYAEDKFGSDSAQVRRYVESSEEILNLGREMGEQRALIQEEFWKQIKYPRRVSEVAGKLFSQTYDTPNSVLNFIYWKEKKLKDKIQEYDFYVKKFAFLGGITAAVGTGLLVNQGQYWYKNYKENAAWNDFKKGELAFESILAYELDKFVTIFLPALERINDIIDVFYKEFPDDKGWHASLEWVLDGVNDDAEKAKMFNCLLNRLLIPAIERKTVLFDVPQTHQSAQAICGLTQSSKWGLSGWRRDFSKDQYRRASMQAKVLKCIIEGRVSPKVLIQ